METGTLEQIGAKDGDKVFCISNIIDSEINDLYSMFTPGRCYTFASRGMIGDNGNEWSGLHPYCGVWRIISRAAPTPDLTAITTPFGLLDEATQEALRAHGGPYEYWYEGEWHDSEQPLSLSCWAWRVKSDPITETETMKITNANGMPMAYATVTTRNGEPDWTTLKVEPR